MHPVQLICNRRQLLAAVSGSHRPAASLFDSGAFGLFGACLAALRRLYYSCGRAARLPRLRRFEGLRAGAGSMSVELYPR